MEAVPEIVKQAEQFTYCNAQADYAQVAHCRDPSTQTQSIISPAIVIAHAWHVRVFVSNAEY
jgi:hypothetical protein